jgi:hypothetical protein
VPASRIAVLRAGPPLDELVEAMALDRPTVPAAATNRKAALAEPLAHLDRVVP